MKQKVKIKTSSSDNVIRTIFREELKTFATNEGLKNLEANIDIKLETLEIKVDEKARQYRDEVLTSNDKLAKRFETVQQELEIGNIQMRRQMEDHDDRLKVLESSQKS